MMSVDLKIPEIKVFLKCQICVIFLTSPSFSVIKTHFEKCQHNKYGINKSLTRLAEENEDLFDDFIDNKTESVTFSQPFVLLNRCNLEHSTADESEQIRVKKIKKPTPRKSRLKALETLSKITKMESKDEEDFENEEDWESSFNEVNDEFITNFTEKPTKQSIKHQNSSCAYDNPNYPLKCNLCTTRFRTENRLAWHKRYVHGGQDAFTCSICGRMFHQRNFLQIHLKSHEDAEDMEHQFSLFQKWPEAPKRNNKNHGIKFNCKYCLMPHYSQAKFITHMTTDHSDNGEQSSFTCPYTCSTRTTSIKQLIHHFKTAHSELYQGNAITYKKGKPTKKCDECGKLFDIYYFPAHVALHAAGKAPEEYANAIQCPYPNCKTKCKEMRYFKHHFTLHLQNNPYICIFPGCTLKLGDVNRLKLHMKLHMTPPTTCSKCGVSYTRIWNLNNHNCQFNIDKQKTGEFKLVLVGNGWRLKHAQMADSSENCDANKSRLSIDDFPDKYMQYIKSLQRLNMAPIIRSDPVFIQACKDSPGFGELLLGVHNVNCNIRSDGNKTHIKRFQCSKCPTVIAGKRGYVEHQKHCTGNKRAPKPSSETNPSSAGKGSNLQIGCPVYGVSFAGADLLEKHFSQEHRNKNLQCEAPKCGMYFLNSSLKQAHFRRYHVHRPYPCPKCDRSYITKTNFEEHLKSHRLETRVAVDKAPCEICGIKFANIYGVRRHKKRVHGISVPLPGRKTAKTIKKNKKTAAVTVNKKLRLAKDDKNVTKNLRRSGRKRIVKKFIDLNSSLVVAKKRKQDEEIIQVKIEPDLHIMPDLIESDDDPAIQVDSGQIVKCEMKDSEKMF